MDLLDGIEDASSKVYDNFVNTKEDYDTASDSDAVDYDAISKGLSSLGSLGSSSILSKIKQRLTGESDLDSVSLGTSMLSKLPQLEIDESDFQTQPRDTQPVNVIQEEDKNEDATKFDAYPETQAIQAISQPATQAIQAITQPTTQAIQAITQPTTQAIQLITQPTQPINTQSLSLTQLIDATQKIGESIFLEDTQKISPVPRETLSLAEEKPEDRGAKIARLAEEKRLQRLVREELEADISHTTLTDEENDLAPDSVVYTNTKDTVSRKGIEETEKFLNVQRRNINIRPEFERKVVFTTKKLLSAFNDSDDEPSLDLHNIASSPTTSPVKTDIAKDFSTQPSNPINAYAQNLRRQLFSSPRENEQPRRMIKLDDSDSDIEVGSSPLRSPSVAAPKKFTEELATVPELSKDQKFMIKQRFSKKKKAPVQDSDAKSLFSELRRANIDQLKAHILTNPEHEIIEEREKDEEVMGSLLEREMERVRNIRKKEKLRERAKQALMNNDYQPEESLEEEQVPDSESGSENDEEEVDEEEGGDDEEEEEEEEEEDLVNIKRRNKLVVSDDEDENELSIVAKPKSIPDHLRHDDSYMFGSSHEEVENDDLITTITTQKVKDSFRGAASLTQNFEQDLQAKNDDSFHDDSYELFQNLKPRIDPSQMSQSQGTQVVATSIPIFKDLSEPNTQRTQKDESTQADLSAAYDDETQKDDVTPASVKQAREELQKNHFEVEEDSDEEDPLLLQQRIKMYEDKIRKNELRARKRRKEQEKHGVKNILDGEAQESEDEWHGLGGEDGEISDQANSEDERMIDNTLNLDLKNDDIRKKFMEDYQITDQKELEKLLDDIKNHRLTKKVGSGGLDIELSDEEDELLAAYRRQKYLEQQERLQKNKQMQLLAKNEKVKAFFASIQETPSIIKIDDDEDVEEEEKEAGVDKNDTEEDDDLEKEPVKKTLKLEASFVQRQLSFLTRGDEDYEKRQHISDIQHGLVSSDEEDLQTLKSRSLSNLTSKTSQSSSQKRPVTVETDDDEFIPVFKKPSYMKSIRSFHEQQSIEIKDGKQFTGVKISRDYKVAAGSKAAINFKKKQFRGLKVKKDPPKLF